MTAERTRIHKELVCSLQVFETRPAQTWRRIRRLEVSRPSGDRNGSLITSLWLPLADVELRSLGENEVLMHWSDCNQSHRHRTGDYGECEDRVYKKTSPNNQIKLRFNNPNDVLRFRHRMLSLTADPFVVRQKRAVAVSAATRLKLYSIYPSFEIGPGSASDHRALLVLKSGSNGSTSSRLYLAWRELDFEIEFPCSDNGSQFQLKFDCLRSPHYISDVVHRRAPEPESIGRHHATRLVINQKLMLECPLGDEPSHTAIPKGMLAGSSSVTLQLTRISQA